MRRPNPLDLKVSALEKNDIKAPKQRHVTDSVCHAYIASRVLHILHLKSQIGQVRIWTVLRLKLGSRMTH